MSTREIAFGEFHPNKSSNKKLEAFQKLDSMIEEVPELDYDKELAEYREEKYETNSVL